AVGDAVAVGIRVSRIRLTWIDPPVAVLVLLAVGEAVAVGVGLERIGGVVTARRSGEESARARRFGALRPPELQSVREAVPVRIRQQRIRAQGELLEVRYPIAIGVLGEGLGTQGHLLAVGQSVSLSLWIARTLH